MNDYLIMAAPRATQPIVTEGCPYHFCGQFGWVGDNTVVIVLHTEDPSRPEDTLIARRLEGEAAATILDADLYQQIRPFGNNPDGTATGELRFAYVDGWPDRLFDTGKAYPDDNEPFDIIISYYWYDQAEFSGYGFLAEMVGDAVTRDPSSRAMAKYSDPEWKNFLWTGGSFVKGPSRLGQVDTNGDPLQVWYSDTPPGFRDQEKVPLYLCVLYGSAQEGCCALTPDV